MRTYLQLIILTLGTLLSWPAQAQNVSIQAQLDRAEIKTGEQAIIDVVIRTDDLARTHFFVAENDQEPSRFRILEFGAVDTVQIDDKLREIQAKMLITSFDSTLIVIPPIVVETPSGRAQTEPLALNVIQPEVDLDHPEQFEDIKAPWGVSWGLADILELILRHPAFWIILLLAITAYSIYRYRQLPKDVKLPVASTPTREITEKPLERIERELREIEARAYWRSGAYKQFYSEVIESLKHYIYAVKGWHVLEMTTSELNDYLYRRGEDRELRTLLEGLQREADLSKFAKSTPTEGDARNSLADARSFVLRTQSLWLAAQEEADNSDIAEGRAEV
ncbi:hypothetical protein [Porphyromonas sp. COT-290 OH860]|uniref:hypothetical protein n=1 Tax=Porphyromonas sp. COT-290 OH860 TaxID=1515615 RepID=UPI00052BBE83|nr:hypothetical protein [Porphyromonas sp. COT-290 OH860]KGN86404.1 hypothetical protein HQ41_01515 [Porphyromonas sp. COT-290 OH860]